MQNLIVIIIYLIGVAGVWMVFQKAGIEGWKAIIPFYNMWERHPR